MCCKWVVWVCGQQWLREVLDEALTIRNSEMQQAKVRLAVYFLLFLVCHHAVRLYSCCEAVLQLICVDNSSTSLVQIFCAVAAH
jgi:hypothetical protein